MMPRWILIAALSLGSVSAHAKTVRITIDKMVFTPAEVTAKVGDTVEWINKDVLAHTATAANKDWDSVIESKKTGTTVLQKAGTVSYFCKYHPNMTGRIIIEP